MAKSPENQRTPCTMEKCGDCGLKPAIFLYYVWYKGRYLHSCTACVLNLHTGAFCPSCFKVYDNQYSPPRDCVKCTGCKAVYHLTCIPASSSTTTLPTASTPSSSSSFSTSHQAWVCPFCCDANLKFFRFGRNERSTGVDIDSCLASQMLAAATIANRTIEKAVTMTRVRAEILCKEAAQAHKEAKAALLKFNELTSVSQEEDGESESEFVSNYASDDNDEASSDSKFESEFVSDDVSNDDDDDD